MLKPSASSSSVSSLKSHKVFVLGLRNTGKTCLLHQLIYGGKQNYCLPKTTDIDNQLDFGPIEDIYSCIVDTGSVDSSSGIPGIGSGGPTPSKERVHLFETPGYSSIQSFNPDSVRNYANYADAFVLVYSVNSRESFSLVEMIKKAIDKSKETKKDSIPILVLGNKMDRFRERQVDSSEAMNWASKEKVRLLEVTATERATLVEPFVYLVSKLSPSFNTGKGSLGAAFGSKLSAKRTTSNLTIEL